MLQNEGDLLQVDAGKSGESGDDEVLDLLESEAVDSVLAEVLPNRLLHLWPLAEPHSSNR